MTYEFFHITNHMASYSRESLITLEEHAISKFTFFRVKVIEKDKVINVFFNFQLFLLFQDKILDFVIYLLHFIFSKPENENH